MSNNYIQFYTPNTPKLEVLYHKTEKDYKGCILCVHGICHGAWCFENFLMYFPDNGYDCYALSLRGHANSEGFEKINHYKLSDYCDDVQECIRYCTSDECEYKMKSIPFLLGHSMGGAVVQKYIGKYTNAVKGAILFASATAHRMPFFKTIISSLVKKNLLIATKKSWGHIISDEDLAQSAFFDERIKDKENINRYNGLLQKESLIITCLSLYLPYTFEHNIDIPIMVTGSTADSYFPEKSLNKTAKKYHCSKTNKKKYFKILDNLCHDMMLDEKEWKESAKIVLDFMENNK